jgi:hypothetical protein
MRVWRTLTELGVGALLWIIPVGPRLDLSRTVEEGEEAAVD